MFDIFKKKKDGKCKHPHDQLVSALSYTKCGACGELLYAEKHTRPRNYLDKDGTSDHYVI